MLKPEIEAALNQQLNWEQTASQEYLAMCAYFERDNLKGFASFMRRQAEEEREHAYKIFDYIFERGGTAKIQSLPEPPADFASPRAAFQAAYEREKSNTKSIHNLYHLAVEHKDVATQSMLQWFVDEQVEEEAWCQEALGLLDMAADNRSALLMLNNKYGTLTPDD